MNGTSQNPVNLSTLAKRFSDDEAAAMTRFWGDESWESAAYVRREGLLQNLAPEKASDEEFAQAFCKRLTDVGGFMGTSRPIPMRNGKGATLYYLIFALPHETALKAAHSVSKFFVAYPYASRRTSKMAITWKTAV